MRPATILAAYAAALVLVFGAAVAVGTAVGPVGTATSEPTETEQHGEMTDMTEQPGTGEEPR